MQTSTKIALSVAALCAIALVVWSLRPRPVSDVVQIQNQIDAAVNGANQHSVGEIMAVVSPDYQDQYGKVADSLRTMLEGYMRSDPSVAVSVSPPIISVTGTKAVSDCTLTVTDSDPDNKTNFSHPLHLTWKKEHTEAWLLFPTTVWRVVDADAGDLSGDY